MLGLVINCGLPGFFLDKALQDPRMTDDKFGIVFTRAPASQREQILEILRGTDPVELTTGDETVYEVANA
jgi:hypothetical protein